MAAKRITVTIPEHLHRRMVIALPAGKISQFVSEAVEERLGKYQAKKTPREAIEAFRALRERVAPEERGSHEELMELIDRGHE